MDLKEGECDIVPERIPDRFGWLENPGWTARESSKSTNHHFPILASTSLFFLTGSY